MIRSEVPYPAPLIGRHPPEQHLAQHRVLPVWSLALPVAASVCLAILVSGATGTAWLVAAGVFLIGSIVAAVHHAEVIAHRVGEPFGTLLLALAVTVIEVALIVSMMLSGGSNATFIARDTVFAAVMIVCNGVVGLCILAGGMRHHELAFRIEGTNPALTVLSALSILTLVLPNFTVSASGPIFNTAQLVFAGVSSLALYGTFVFIQAIRHRDYFLPVGEHDADIHADPPSNSQAWISGGLLLLALVAVVGLAKSLSPAIAQGIAYIGAPESVIGVAISLLVLLPESVAALRAALANRLQTSLNLSLGSGLASIGLTIPTVALVSIVFSLPLSLGLDGKDLVLLFLTLIVAALTLGTGRTTLLQGVVHLVIFAAYLFLNFVP